MSHPRPAVFSVPTGHPAFAGHFPGNPVVPGVLLLQFIERAARATLGDDIVLTGFPQVKFNAPLLPDETFEVDMAPAREGLAEFIVRRGDTRIASGRLCYSTRPEAPG